MRKILAFSLRNIKELLRDKLTLFFGILFPLIIMGLLTILQNNVPKEASPFPIDSLACGIALFSLSFLTLFGAMNISKDKQTSFLERLVCSPLKARDFILGYSIPLIPLGIVQVVVCYLFAMILGLTPSVNIIFSVLSLIPAILLYVAFGLFFGTILNDKQVGGICGALMTNVSAWLSGVFFSLDLVGKTYKTIAYALPFAHSLDLSKNSLNHSLNGFWLHLFVVLGYTLIIFVASVLIFKKKIYEK